jgi:lipopolysaccharide assembly LptE-like protein
VARYFRRRIGATTVSLASLLCGACIYGFAGGGFAPHLKTVAILPFDNLTPDPLLTREVSEAVREALESRLGLRISGEATADALVRGRVVRYEPGIAVALQSGDDGAFKVNQRQVQLVVDVEIVDQKEGRTVWQRQGLAVIGEYLEGNEIEGRRIALEKLRNEIVDGAQSQW